MSKPLWIRSPLAILAGKEARGGVAVRDGKISELVPSGETPDQPCEIFDASNLVVLPGLINSHHHFYQTLTRAYGPALNKSLFGWLTTLYPVWANLTPDMIRLSTRLALAELLLSGCTCTSDHHYLFTDALGEAIDIQADEVRDLGIRATLSRGSMSLGEKDGGLPPDHVVQSPGAILADSERLIGAYHETGEGALIQIALAPCSPFSVSEELMRETAALARKHNVRLHTHLAETEDENQFCLNTSGVRPLEFLERLDWLGPDVWLAHGIFFDNGELERLGEAGMSVAHCPSSNMYLASGMCRTLELEAAGVNVGLGVDGSASNDCSNLIQETRQAMLLQKLKYGADKVDHLKALTWATQGSARCLGRDGIGRIEVGMQADLALFKLDEPRFSGAEDPLAALVVCGASKADAVMVGGNWRVRDGKVQGLDLGKLIADHSAAASALRAAATPGVEALRF